MSRLYYLLINTYVYFLESILIARHINRLVGHNAQFNGSYRSMENMAEIVNATPNAAIKLPTTKHLIKKSLPPNFIFKTYIKCRTCSIYTTAGYVNETFCQLCNNLTKTSCADYFIYIPIEQQLEQSIRNNIDEILSYYSFVSEQKDISDMHNCCIFALLKQKYPAFIILPIVVNTDGVKVFASADKSLWMIQYYQGFLRPSIRFHPKNVMIAAAHFGSKKPNMKDFFLPFLKEVREINNRGGMTICHNEKSYNFMPSIMSCCCDLPAKADVQGMIGHSGQFGCGFCLHPGISIKPEKNKKAVIRYVKGCDNYELRTHSNTIEIYDRLKTTTIKGIKTKSCMIAAKDFDLINGFAIDYMHCVLLGVTKKLLSLWLDTTNHAQPYYIKKSNQIILSNRLVSLKPISEITRKPRSLFLKRNFKANEFRSLLLYYLYFALDDMLDTKYVKHFRILSSVIYALLKKNISFETVKRARLQLDEFANQFESLYGKSNVTLNIHLLRHISTAVENLGPLWSQSAFAFEALNGVVSKANTSTKDIVHQLVWKYCMRHTLITNENSEEYSDFSLKKKKIIQISATERDLFIQESVKVEKFNKITIFESVIVRGIKYTSQNMRDISTIDYFVKFKADIGYIGAVKFYIISDFTLYAFLDIYEILETFDHFLRISRTDNQKLVKMADIVEKALYLKYGQREYVTSIPNNFEKT